MFSAYLFTVLAAALGAQAASLSLQSPRFVVSSGGVQLRSEPISLAQKAAHPVVLSKSDVLKITFQVVEKEDGKGVQPHQTFLRFYDAKTQEEGIQPIRVSPSGKAKFELNAAKPFSSFPPTTADSPLSVTLLIGSPSHSPLSIPLFDLTVPASHPAPQHPDDVFFHPQPEIAHTFKSDQKLPPKALSAIMAVQVLSPWLVLLPIWSTFAAPTTPYLSTPSIMSFVVSLAAFEGLLVWYWVELRLGQVLSYGALLAVLTVFTGKQALSKIGELRTGRH